jgi:Ca-activated chloride channel family protein
MLTWDTRSIRELSQGTYMTLSIKTDRQLIRAAARSNRYVLLGFTAPQAPRRANRRPVNVAFVLDRSGSMSGENKFPLARQAVEQSLRMLRPEDRFSLVVYDNAVDVLARSANATPDAIRNALNSLSTIEPRGSTDLFSGWMRGCEQVSEFVDEERTTRVLLLTDGLANQGIQDRDTLARHASELRQRGVSTSTFGVGADFDERLLRDMAHEGGGNFYFLENARQIPDLITSELGEALEVVIPHAAIELDLPHRADAEVLNRFRSSHADNSLRIELGDVVSAQEVEVLVRVNFPHGENGARATLNARIVGRNGDVIQSARVEWTYASHLDNDRQPRDVEVDRRVAAIYAARARAEATEANRRHDFAAARRVIERTAARIRQYAGSDPVLDECWRSLEAEIHRYDREEMSPMVMKQAYFVAEMGMKGRGTDGRARRAPR